MNLSTRTPLTLSLASCALAGLLMAGCSKSDNGGGGTTTATTAPGATSTATTSGGSGKTMLAFVTNNPSNYWTICRKGTEAAAKSLPGVTVQFVMPQDGTAATQRQDVDDLIAKGVKGIAISPVDPANETTYLDTVAAKVPLITSDSDAPQSKRLCYIGTDNHAAGVMAGGLIKQAIPQGGKIILFVGKSDAQNAKDRIQGIRDALQGSNVQVTDIRTDDTDQGRAKSNASDMLVAHPDVACLVGIWSYNGPAIASAVKDAGKVGKVKIVCFDADPGTPEGIRSGVIYGTVVQDPYTFGFKSIQLLDQLAHGDKSGLPKNGLIIVPNQAITKANLDAYLADQAKKMSGGA